MRDAFYLFALSCLLITACGEKSGLPAGFKKQPYALRSGQRLYESHCLECHGKEGKGDGLAWTRELPGKPADLSSKAFKNKDRILKFLETPRKGTTCPTWKHTFSLSEMKDLAEFIILRLP